MTLFQLVVSDDRQILCTRQGATGDHLELLPVAGGEPTRFLTSRGNANNGQISPDGKWVAYASDESGNWEIYVTSFPDGCGKVAGITWRRDRTALARRWQERFIYLVPEWHVDGGLGKRRNYAFATGTARASVPGSWPRSDFQHRRFYLRRHQRREALSG